MSFGICPKCRDLGARRSRCAKCGYTDGSDPEDSVVPVGPSPTTWVVIVSIVLAIGVGVFLMVKFGSSWGFDAAVREKAEELADGSLTGPMLDAVDMVIVQDARGHDNFGLGNGAGVKLSDALAQRLSKYDRMSFDMQVKNITMALNGPTKIPEGATYVTRLGEPLNVEVQFHRGEIWVKNGQTGAQEGTRVSVGGKTYNYKAGKWWP